MSRGDPEADTRTLRTAEVVLGVAATAWLQVVGLVTGTVIHHILHALPIVLLLPMPRTRMVRLTSAVLGLMWILMLAGISPMIHESLIQGRLFSGGGPSYLWLAPVMAAVCGVWAALNIALLRQGSRDITWLTVGGLFLSPAVALLQPLFALAFELPGERIEQGEHIWAVVLAIEVAALLAIPWLIAVALARIRRQEFSRRIILLQISYWLFFIICMVAGLLPVFNP